MNKLLKRTFGLSFLFLVSCGFLAANEETARKNAESDSTLTLWQLPNKTPSQMASYILKTLSGEVVVIDGGCAGDADYLVEQIKKISGDGKVDAWFLTHCHSDHVNALGSILQNQPNALTIENLYYSFPPREWLDKNETSWKNETDETYSILQNFKKTRSIAPNQVFSFGDKVKLTVLNDFDLSITQNAVNNSGIVFRVETGETSILFLGDLGVEGGVRLMKLQPKEKLKCDVLQMAHHGQNGVTKEFYQATAPKICLWPTPDWLWDNNAGQGYGTGPWKTLEVREWMKELGVEENYIEKDGLIELSFE